MGVSLFPLYLFIYFKLIWFIGKQVGFYWCHTEQCKAAMVAGQKVVGNTDEHERAFWRVEDFTYTLTQSLAPRCDIKNRVSQELLQQQPHVHSRPQNTLGVIGAVTIRVVWGKRGLGFDSSAAPSYFADNLNF